jgi:hypothetical protein
MSQIPANWIRQGDGSYSPPKRCLFAPERFHGQDGVKTQPKRIRQSPKPLLNKLESEWLTQLKHVPIHGCSGVSIHAQAWRVKLANGAWFKVDFCACVAGKWTAWECKGSKDGKNVDRGMLALKCAAAQFPEVRWILVWKEKGKWMTQQVLS